MATLVLTAVGTAIGGPIGGAIGAILGQSVDQRLLAPKARQGPRLGDLAVQTSTYGTQIPKLFGRTRVAGTVIWATDLKETRTRKSQGKGRPKVDTYSYAASFAVALSGRAVLRVERIWADGKLLRGAAGDWKFDATMRLHDGGEAQALDPLLASTEGIGTTPAYRGVAYAVFEDLQLADFGNRIPSLSFEVVADEAGVAAGAMLARLSAGAIDGSGGPVLRGFAALGNSLGGVAEAIGEVAPFGIDSGARVALRYGAGPSRVVVDDQMGAAAGSGRASRLAIDRASVDALPGRLSLGYYDVDRDYQPGTQRAARENSRRDDRVELAAAMSASEAKALVEARIATAWRERSRATLTLPWAALAIEPGDLLDISGGANKGRATKVSFENMVLKVETVSQTSSVAVAAIADAGRPVSQPDTVHGPTTLVIVDFPPLRDEPESGAMLAVLANGTSGGWRRAALLASVDGGVTFSDAGATAAPATIGTTASVLQAASSDLIDTRSVVDVDLLHAGLNLSDADDAQLVAGANRAMVGRELVQFGHAEPLGGVRWRLSRLLRGRRGTEAMVGDHAVGERFILIEPEAMFILPVSLAVGAVRILAVGVGDAGGVTATAPATIGSAVRPLSPVGLRGTVRGDGGFDVTWTRRSRDGWLWRDGVDAPLGEERGSYYVDIVAGSRAQTVETLGPALIYSASQRAADVAMGASSATITVRQVGTFGLSSPATVSIAL